MPSSLHSGTSRSKKLQVHALRRRVRREVQDQQLRPRLHARQLVLQPRQQLLLTGSIERDALDLRARDHRPEDVDRIAWIWHRHGIFIVEHRQAKVRDALLRANGDDRLGLGIEIDVVSVLVPVTDRAAQPRDSARKRVAMRPRPLGRLDQLVYDELRRGAIGIAHPEVDHVLAAPARRSLQLAGDVEHIRRKARQPSETLPCSRPLGLISET